MKEESEEEMKDDEKKLLNKILEELTDIKASLKSLVDGNTKMNNDANVIAKETLQEVARTVNS